VTLKSADIKSLIAHGKIELVLCDVTFGLCYVIAIVVADAVSTSISSSSSKKRPVVEKDLLLP